MSAVSFQLNGKGQMSSPFIKKIVAKSNQITDQYHYYQFEVKFLKKSYLIACKSSSLKMTYYKKNQSGFRPGDSTINQLLSITTEIFNAFENFEETRAVFLDISKAFDKVWHEGLCFKLKRNGIIRN